MIQIFISPNNRMGYIWNANDWLRIREQYRIVGYLIGSLSNYPRQDAFAGLPLLLSAEEITLLKEQKLARLVHCPALLEAPSEALKSQFVEQEIKFHESQKSLYLQKKASEVERRLDKIIEGKRKKDTTFTSNVDKKNLILEEVDKILSVSAGRVTCIPTDDAWIGDHDLVEAEWPHPHSNFERLKYDIFKDLWTKGYYLTSGTKFGGDFLCYLGDPVKFHASFIVVCKEWTSEFSLKDLIACGRIGSTTRKTVVIASQRECTIVYQSLRWIGSSNEIKPTTDTDDAL